MRKIDNNGGRIPNQLNNQPLTGFAFGLRKRQRGEKRQREKRQRLLCFSAFLFSQKSGNQIKKEDKEEHNENRERKGDEYLWLTERNQQSTSACNKTNSHQQSTTYFLDDNSKETRRVRRMNR